MNASRVSLIGAPTDVGAGMPGTRMGPEALRVAGLAEAIAAAVSWVRPTRGNPPLPVSAIYRR